MHLIQPSYKNFFVKLDLPKTKLQCLSIDHDWYFPVVYDVCHMQKQIQMIFTFTIQMIFTFTILFGHKRNIKRVNNKSCQKVLKKSIVPVLMRI